MSKSSPALADALAAITAQPLHHAFALCKLPDSTDFYLTWQPNNAEVREIPFAAIGQTRGFVIAPFNAQDTARLIAGEPLLGHIAQLPHAPLCANAVGCASPRAAYAKAFERCKEALQRGVVAKVVLSRVEDYTCANAIDVVRLFAEACRCYPRQYVALWHVAAMGFWLVATPEPLLLAHDGHIETVALAGTQWQKATWDTKNNAEQAMVATYVADVLTPHVDALKMEGPTTIYAGHLAHLRTRFSARCREPRALGALFSALHPTPAVCGVPKASAQQLIAAAEAHERAYYTGFSGLVRAVGCIDSYVTLRCMNILRQNGHDAIRLYAGGGLLPESQEAEEWQETEHKLGTMRHLLVSQ